MHRLPFDVSFSKDPDLYYMDMDASSMFLQNDLFIENFKDGEQYQAKDVPGFMLFADQINEQEARMQATGETASCVMLSNTEMGWIQTSVSKTVASDGGLDCVGGRVTLPHLYGGWHALLCHDSDRLEIRSGADGPEWLSRGDLGLLHLLVIGQPRKNMARHYSVSVKAIEKRMLKIKGILSPAGVTHLSLHECLAELHLIGFIAAQYDWFAPITMTTVYRPGGRVAAPPR